MILRHAVREGRRGYAGLSASKLRIASGSCLIASSKARAGASKARLHSSRLPQSLKNGSIIY
jgi:hypothetical protein